MAGKIEAVERVSNFGDQIVVEFSNGVTVRYGVEFLLRYQASEGNSVVENEEPEGE